MRTLLELIRIIIIFAIVGSALGYLLKNIYLEMGVDIEKYGSIGLSLFLFYFLFYIETSCNSMVGTREKAEKNFLE
ncbi:hypothetical protein [Psychrobacillus sp. INOP01]|uniref:hypothetical protein n=1 Tax=Psychrobacillus sp. INOP01 TaxID=2829187 RepID=UPI001F15B44F|nr:hypothetical protein [Psychrobacillus sp. INOP01]